MAKASERRSSGGGSGKARSAGQRRAGGARIGKVAEGYTHPDQALLMRPEVGTQAQFRRKKAPVTYRYDSSLSPALDWDDQNGAREMGEAAVSDVREGARDLAKAIDTLKSPDMTVPPDFMRAASEALVRVEGAADTLRRISKPFLNWAGKAERLSFDVPTLPLFVHERLSTKAIVETLVGHKTDKQTDIWELLGDPRHSYADQVLKAYEYQDNWVNRLILGDSLVVMNSLLHYERLGGQVQMIYIDPPYGVKFGSNFQPFVRKRDVSHGDDEDLTREPEMVKAYRDTWELGLHSYLTYMRDRLLLARELLTPSGSVFVQISDENLHHVRELMDEVFGAENFIVLICYRRLGMMIGEMVQSSAHYLLWYARDKEKVKHRKLFDEQIAGVGTGDHYTQLENRQSHDTRAMSPDERAQSSSISSEWRPFQLISLTTGGYRPNTTIEFTFEGATYHPGPNKCWRTTREGLDRLVSLGRVAKAGGTLRYKQYLDDFPLTERTTIWDDTARDPENFYVVQTPSNVISRCLLMTTDPGDLVLDPTCGSGTTPYVAEQWGRRWITIDTSRVPLALARQRLLTATFHYYELKEPAHGPSGGFVYKRKQNNKGEEVGGIVPHVTLKSIANSEPPDEEVLVDRPEVDNKFVRVTGPFVVEATIPTPIDWDPPAPDERATAGKGVTSSVEESDSYGSFVERMIEVLRRSPVLHVGGGKTVQLGNIRPPAKSLSLSAEGVVISKVRLPSTALRPGKPDTTTDQALKPDATTDLTTAEEAQPVAFVFGPENGAISEKLVHSALQEAQLKSYAHLYVIGFAIQPHARQLIDNAAGMGLVPATYVQATPDLMMGDLLKNMRSSQIFSVCGLPEIKIHHAKPAATGGPPRYEIELVGLDTFDPTTMDTDHRGGGDVPCWLLDADYNNLCFRASQVFFPRTAAWDSLKKALKADYDESVWDHLSGTRSAPFEVGEQRQVAVKVIDDRGNELLVVKALG